MMKKADNDIMKSSDAMQTTTTQKFDYIKHDVQRLPFHQPDVYRKPEGEIDTTSSYAKEYNYTYQQKVQPIRQDRKKPALGDFDPTTTAKSDYRQWDIVKSKTYAPDRNYRIPENVFEGASTYNQDFHTHQNRPRDLIKPVTNTKFSNEPFNDMTSNRHDFTRHELPKKFSKPVTEYTPNRIPLDSMTTMKLDYTAKDGMETRLKSFKPVNTGVHTEEPFMASTTQKDDFKQWQVQPFIARKDNEYKQPLGEMCLNTNYNSDFTGASQAPARAIRPPPRKRVDAKFEGQSTYEMDFHKRVGVRPAIIKGVEEFRMPDVPFEGQSTYKTQFYGVQGDPAKTTKPELKHTMPEEPFRADTSYRVEYTKKSKF